MALLAAFEKFKVLDSDIELAIYDFFKKDYNFLKKVDMVPIGLSEIIPISLFYPIIFKSVEQDLAPFAIISVKGTPFYLKTEKELIINVLPKICELYPFGLLKNKEEYLIVVDELCYISEHIDNRIKKQFVDNSIDKKKEELTEFLKDFTKAKEFAKEIFEMKCLKKISIEVNTPFGTTFYKNIYIADIEGLYKISPEKLYYANYKGYLPLLYAVYFSVRNFQLLGIVAKEVIIKKEKETKEEFKMILENSSDQACFQEKLL